MSLVVRECNKKLNCLFGNSVLDLVIRLIEIDLFDVKPATSVYPAVQGYPMQFLLRFLVDAVKQLIMFGDAYPHDFEDFPRILTSTKYKLATRQLDWRDEADDLLRMVSYRNKSNYKL